MSKPPKKPLEITSEDEKRRIHDLTFRKPEYQIIWAKKNIRNIKQYFMRNPESLMLMVNPIAEEWYEFHRNGKLFRVR